MKLDLPPSLCQSLAQASQNNTLSIAFSGGFDSRFLVWAALHLDYRVEAFHAIGPHICADDTQSAESLAHDYPTKNFSLTRIAWNPQALPGYETFGKDRCYFCKKALFTKILKKAKTPLCDGTTASDFLHFRPGLRALKELKVLSPLAQAGLSKAQCREIALHNVFINPNQSSRSCLLTRFPYGVRPESEQLLFAQLVETYCLRHPIGKKVALRLRFPDGQTPMLHVNQQQWDALSTHEKQQFNETFHTKFGNVAIVPLKKLSGFFDNRE